jgi:transaldolase
MKFFIDTANVAEIKQAKEMGMADGVTTNPSLVARENRAFRPLIEEICRIVEGPVSAEVVSQETEDMVKEAENLAKIAENIVVKIPMTVEGLKATKVLSEKDIRVNMTLAFSPLQALLAAKAGASYVSPFVGRLDDIAHDGMKLVEQIITIYENYDFPTEVIVASVRHPLHVLHAALLGADIATIPFKVIKQLAKHPLTDIGLKRFLDDWQKVTDKLL